MFDANRRCRNAFTLLELILVMIIICTMLAMAAPNLRGFFSSRQLKNIAEQMSILCRYADDRATMETITHRLYIDTNDNKYWLTAMQQGQYLMLEGKLGEKFNIPEDVRLTFNNIRTDNGLYYIEFLPDRLTGENSIILEDSVNKVMLYSSGLMEGYRVVELND